MKRFTRVAWIALFAAAACSSNPVNIDIEPAASASVDVRADLGSSFRIRAGEVAELDAGKLRIAFRGVANDSRCPEEFTCVWAGDATLTLGLATPGTDWHWTTVHTGVEPLTASHAGYTVRVVALEPGNGQGRVIEQREYIAELRVERS